MNANEQKQFVRELCEAISAQILNDIDAGKIPENWDGRELRQLISDRAAWRTMDKKRAREYRNTVLVNNL